MTRKVLYLPGAVSGRSGVPGSLVLQVYTCSALCSQGKPPSGPLGSQAHVPCPASCLVSAACPHALPTPDPAPTPSSGAGVPQGHGRRCLTGSWTRATTRSETRATWCGRSWRRWPLPALTQDRAQEPPRWDGSRSKVSWQLARRLGWAALQAMVTLWGFMVSSSAYSHAIPRLEQLENLVYYNNRLKNSKIVISDFHLAKLENGLIQGALWNPEYLGKQGVGQGRVGHSLQRLTLGSGGGSPHPSKWVARWYRARPGLILTSRWILFAAPEVVGRQRYGRPVDCWAIKVIMYIL